MTPAEEARVRAVLLAPRSRGLGGRDRDRIIRVGRGVRFALYKILDVVLADVRESESHVMPIATYHLSIFVNADPEKMLDEVADLVRENTPPGTLVTLELRRASWWDRLRGWWLVRRSR